MEKGISVIIPTFNREGSIKTAIQSVLNQSYEGKTEIIISDDGSTDRTIEVAKSYGKDIVIIKKSKYCSVQGAAGARNRGIKAATCEYICFLDSDDFFLPDHLKKMSDALNKNPSSNFAFCRVLEAKKENGHWLARPWTQSKIFKKDIENLGISRENIVHTNSFIFRKKIFDNIGFFNESYSNGEDTDMWIRVSEKYDGEFVDNYGAVYVTFHSDDQLTKNSATETKKQLIQILENAKSRYFDLDLKDTFRIFKIEQLLLRRMNTKRSLYYLYYICLVLRYPVQYFKYKYYESQSDYKKMLWKDIKNYVTETKFASEIQTMRKYGNVQK